MKKKLFGVINITVKHENNHLYMIALRENFCENTKARTKQQKCVGNESCLKTFPLLNENST